ncbi:MAG: GtrA family protein [Oscillospiraceae bacterium]|jgi:putative flippase GtrA
MKKFFKRLFTGKADSLLIEFLRSIIVGVTSWLVDFGVLALLKEAFGADALAASVLSFILGTALNYYLSTNWAYASTNVDNGVKRFIIFLAISAVGLGINSAVIWLFDRKLTETGALGSLIPVRYYYMVGKVCAGIVGYLWNFTAKKFILYREPKGSDKTDTEDSK